MFSSQNTRLAVVGGGYWGRNLVRVFHSLGVLHTICDANVNTLEELASRFHVAVATPSLDEVLEDDSVTAVAIAAPAEAHRELVMRSLLSNKDVFVEKPLCLDVSDGEELVRAAKERGRILMVGHLLQYHPAVRALFSLVRSGALGRLRYVYSTRANLGKIRREENILWSFAPHDISVLLALVGEMPNRVSAEGSSFLHPAIADTTVSFLSFPSGVRAHIFVSWIHPIKEQRLIVVGERQMAVFDDTLKSDKLTLFPHAIEWKDHVPVAVKAAGQSVQYDASVEPLAAECLHFLECIASRKQPITDGEEGLRVLSVLSNLQQSLTAGASATDRNLVVGKGNSVHCSAYVHQNVVIGPGTKVWHFSHLMDGSVVGSDCRIGQNVVVGPRAIVGSRVKIQNNVSVFEGVTLEDDVFCGPSVVFTNVRNPRSEISRMAELRRTVVRHGATLGANCTIVCGVEVGEYAFVGAGAVVTKDIPPYGLVVGNPGRVIGWMCRCAEARIEFAENEGKCSYCGESYVKSGELVSRIC